MYNNRNERRRAPRAPINVELELSGDAVGGEGALLTESLNLSTEGVYCTSPRYIAPLTKLELTLMVPWEDAQGRTGKRGIRCEAVTVRSYPERESPNCKSYEVACYFTSMTEEDRETLRDFLAVSAREG
jgi:hypothetical protein